MASAEGAVAPTRHDFEFRGTGGEFFRIWILNLALTLLTFGIYSAWAKVRTRRYLYGNTYIAGHALDYDPSPWRILIGRLIAHAPAFAQFANELVEWARKSGEEMPSQLVELAHNAQDLLTSLNRDPD